MIFRNILFRDKFDFKTGTRKESVCQVGIMDRTGYPVLLLPKSEQCGISAITGEVHREESFLI